MEWYRFLPGDLLMSAYKAGPELAWGKHDALRVLEILTQSGYVIDGVDIWIPTDDGPTIPTPFVYDWSPARSSSQRDRDISAREFIEGFKWDSTDHSHGGREPYFNILASARIS